eukprot:CAMPEP_0114533834 /NCGR_PEP_ID=MMETSP0109-20121206/27478_1 /TAXON_ID=29199 /ORGANISM="Chlorarachnion reptans, Strain CCCM449" /LENGTH=224 /DNA_ID=CAMNT_0001717127 /DNA_START=419 /DNA_END=1093 /DNA_ORIENTATION=-
MAAKRTCPIKSVDGIHRYPETFSSAYVKCYKDGPIAAKPGRVLVRFAAYRKHLSSVNSKEKNLELDVPRSTEDSREMARIQAQKGIDNDEKMERGSMEKRITRLGNIAANEQVDILRRKGNLGTNTEDRLGALTSMVCMWRETNTSMQIWMVGTSSRFHRQGHAKTLTSHVPTELLTDNEKTRKRIVVLVTQESNCPAMRLVSDLGMQSLGKQRLFLFTENSKK